MDVGQLRAHIDDLQKTLAKKVSEQRAYFEGQLAELGGYVTKKASAAVKAVAPSSGHKGKREGQAEVSKQEEQELEVVGRSLIHLAA